MNDEPSFTKEEIIYIMDLTMQVMMTAAENQKGTITPDMEINLIRAGMGMAFGVGKAYVQTDRRLPFIKRMDLALEIALSESKQFKKEHKNNTNSRKT